MLNAGARPPEITDSLEASDAVRQTLQRWHSERRG
jgi:hypothetical protein